ncbi:PIG-L deacetylase family protein [Verrucomicrobiota bacterium]
MKLNNTDADIYVPDGVDVEKALKRTTHLAIGAHQDDLEIMAYHGIAECYEKEDKWFTGVILTNGAGSPRTGKYAECTDEDMQKLRQEEQRKAAKSGKYSCMLQLMYSSSQIKDASNSDPANNIRLIMESALPEVVYLHNPADKHDTHVASLLRALTAIRTLPHDKQPSKVYGCEVWRDLDWLDDKEKQTLAVDKYPELAASLMGFYESQISGGKRYDLAAQGRRLANATFFASHGVDEAEGLTFAMDLTPLIKSNTLSITEYTLAFIEKFKTDVKARLEKL